MKKALAGKGLRLRGSCVATFTFERQNVLPEVIGQLHDGQGRAWRHHTTIVASLGCGRPYSWLAPSNTV